MPGHTVMLRKIRKLRRDFQMFVLMRMPMMIATVMMGFHMHLAGHGIKFTMAHTGLGQNLVGKGANFGKTAAQGHAFKAGIMINMKMNGRYRQIMMFVLGAHQAGCQHAFFVIIHLI